MRIENRRVVHRTQINKSIIEDDDQGLFLTDCELNTLEKLAYNNFQLLDFSPDGNIILLNSKEWLTIRNANKTILTAIDIKERKQLFSTDKFLAFRSLIDSTSSFFLLEYYSGLCSVNISTGEVIYRKDRIDKTLYNADLHVKSNILYIPTDKKSLLLFDFNSHNLSEIKLEKTSRTTWLKFNDAQTHLLISDKKNVLHCFEANNLNVPVWTQDFSKFKKDGKIWTHKIHTTKSNLGCIHGFTPDPNQNAYAGGTLYIFDILTGEILDTYDYSNLKEALITDFQEDEIIIDNLKSLSLSSKIISPTPVTGLFRIY